MKNSIPIIAVSFSLWLFLSTELVDAQNNYDQLSLNAPASTATLEADSIAIANSIPATIDDRSVSYAANFAETHSKGSSEEDSELVNMLLTQAESLTQREGTSSSIQLVLLLGALSLAPAILLMTTSYIRIIVVLTLLRQAFGGQQLPPTQVLTALSLFLTLVVMTPVWKDVKTDAIDPYVQSDSVSWEEAWHHGIKPVKKFMAQQIEVAGNTNSIAVFYKHSAGGTSNLPETIDEVPINILLPAFIVSELKVAFLLGFQIFLPFLVLDFVVSTVTVSMGMMMLPPTMVSFPLKLILFVMVDGWNMVVGMLLQSFGPFV